MEVTLRKLDTVRPIGKPSGEGIAGKKLDWRQPYLRRQEFLDAVAICVAMILSQVIRFGNELDTSELVFFSYQVSYWVVGLLLGCAWWLVLGASGSRHVRLIGQGAEAGRKIFSATLSLFGSVAILSYILGLPTARGYILIALPTGLLFIFLARFANQRYLMLQRVRNDKYLSQTLILGNRLAAEQVMKHMLSVPAAGLKPVAIYHPRKENGPVVLEGYYDDNIRYLRGRPRVNDVLSTLQVVGAETVVVTDETGLKPQEVRRLGWSFADTGIRLIIAPSISGIAGPRIHSQPLNGLPLIHVSTPQLSGLKKNVKRGFDLVGSIALLLLLTPLMLAVALAVKLVDGGPVFFRQQRVGMNGAHFTMYKFRSMVSDAEQRRADLNSDQGKENVLFKMKDDPRVTPLGRFLRKYSIDELPQLINVLLGQMSLVGSRPPLPSEVEQYEADAHRRPLVQPGITGLWQVSGRSDLTWAQAVHLDLYYVENWSISSYS